MADLQSRQKWVKPVKNVQVGDIVLIVEDSSPRGSWRLGRVTEVHPGKDGLVRSTTIEMGDACLDDKGKRARPLTKLSRPVQKLVLLLEH